MVQIGSFRSGSLLHAAICMVSDAKTAISAALTPSATLRP